MHSKHILINNSYSSKIRNNYYTTYLNYGRVRDHLSVHGKSIESISLCHKREKQFLLDRSYTGDRKPIDDIFNTIAEFCGNSLTKLSIHTEYINFNTRSEFKVLNELSFSNTLIFDLGPHQKLKILRVHRGIFDDNAWDGVEFPELNEAFFLSMERLTDDDLIAFQKCSPQLKSLVITNPKENSTITSLIFREMGSRMPNLTKLVFNCHVSDGAKLNFEQADLMHLSDLKNLKILELSGIESHLDALFKSLNENDVSIESLDIWTSNYDYMENLMKLKLKFLAIGNIKSIPEDIAIKFVTEMSTLTFLRLRGPYQSLCFISQILECATHLTGLEVTLKDAKIALEEYNSVLLLATDKVEVKIHFFSGIINVDEDILKANSKYLFIDRNN